MKTDMCYYKVGAAEEKCFKKNYKHIILYML